MDFESSVSTVPKDEHLEIDVIYIGNVASGAAAGASSAVFVYSLD